MVRSPLTKLVKIAWLLLVLMLLFAVPASSAFLTFVEVHKDGGDGLDFAGSMAVSPDGAHIYHWLRRQCGGGVQPGQDDGQADLSRGA